MGRNSFNTSADSANWLVHPDLRGEFIRGWDNGEVLILSTLVRRKF